MKVKVEFEAEVEQMAGKNCLVMVPKVDGVFQQRIWFPGSACTPVLPDFGAGDLVEHVPSGARGIITPYDCGRLIVETTGKKKEIRIEVPTCRRYDGVGNGANWLAADCRIVRKAGEEE